MWPENIPPSHFNFEHTVGFPSQVTGMAICREEGMCFFGSDGFHGAQKGQDNNIEDSLSIPYHGLPCGPL